MKSLFSHFVDLLFPKICALCKNPLISSEENICVQCRLDLPVTNSHHYSDSVQFQTINNHLNVQGVYSFLEFTTHGNIQKLLHAIKYQNKPELAYQIGEWYGADLKNSGKTEGVNAIIPVPLHPRRLRERGYNQSAAFGRGLASALQTDVIDNCVLRQKHTQTQTKKSRVERIENMKDVFLVTNSGLVENKNVMLVDDVITTGATMIAIGELLLAAQVKSIVFVTIARA